MFPLPPIGARAKRGLLDNCGKRMFAPVLGCTHRRPRGAAFSNQMYNAQERWERQGAKTFCAPCNLHAFS